MNCSKKKKTNRKIVFYDTGKAPPANPNLEFVHAFDSINSFWEAAGFIGEWIRKLKHSPGEIARDLPTLMENALLIRAILRHVGKGTPAQQPSMGKENISNDPAASEKQPQATAKDGRIFSRDLD